MIDSDIWKADFEVKYSFGVFLIFYRNTNQPEDMYNLYMYLFSIL